VDQKVDIRGALSKVGLLQAKTYDQAAAEGSTGEDKKEDSWLERAVSGSSSTVALAFVCNKALFPIRTPITLALTPTVARFLRRRNIIKKL
jgi:hypothetical protein